jgi:hypothetical protein
MRCMARVRLIHWHAEEAAELGAMLEKAGHSVEARPLETGNFAKIRARPPDVYVISLDRLPSHGREVAFALRESKTTRTVPIVFAGGAQDKVERIRSSLPDASYTPWSHIRSAVRNAIAQPPAAPIVPSARATGYSGTPLPRKLGIKPGSTLALVRAPQDFEATLGELPEGVEIRKSTRGTVDLAVWFPRSRADLVDRLDAMEHLVGDGTLWIAWPKKSSGVATDLTEPIVREAGLAAGLVDSKICAIDETWSGLRFTRRR